MENQSLRKIEFPILRKSIYKILNYSICNGLLACFYSIKPRFQLGGRFRFQNIFKELIDFKNHGTVVEWRI